MKKTLLILTLLLLLPSLLFATSGSVKNETAISSLGIPIPNPTVTVCASNATGIPCSPLATIYTDKTLGVTAPNPFTGDTFGNFTFYAAPGYYAIQVAAPGYASYTYLVLLAPDVADEGDVKLHSSASTTVNPAASGVYRLAGTDSVCWRNAANTADVCLSKDGSDHIIGATATATTASSVTSATANPSATGVIKLAAGDQACWRNSGNTADVCVGKDAADRINFLSGISAANYTTTAASPAQSGLVRLNHTDVVCWRNEADTADICLSKNGSDQIVGATASVTSATSVISASANPAVTGVVRLASTDLGACWRNTANTADVCFSKNAADQIVLPNGIVLNGDFAMTSAPRMTWAMWNSTTSTSIFTMASWKPSKPISITGFSVWLSSAPVGCTVFPIFQVFDQTTSVSLTTITSVSGTQGYWQTGLTGLNVAASDELRIKVSTAGTGCSTNASAPAATVEYRMQ